MESKSLKLYLFSFRNHGDFHEDVINIIMKDLIQLLERELLGNKLPEHLKSGGIPPFFQGASMTPILLAFQLCSYFYYFWIF